MDSRIDRLQRLGSRRDNVIGLGGGLPANELFPRAALGRAFVAALQRTDGLQYGWPEGSAALRAWIAARLRKRGADVTEEEVIVTSGAQQALAVAVGALETSESAHLAETRIEVDPESYPAALELFRTLGVRPIVSTSSETRGDASYVMPGVSNPRGEGISLARRRALLAGGAPILADEAYAELRFDGRLERPLLAEARDRVFHIGTFSKTLCPGLRVGFLVPPRKQLARALRMKHDLDLQAASLTQVVLEELLVHDDFDARLVRARRFYASRAARLLCAVRRAFPSFRVTEPEGGFALWVETDEEGDDAALLAIATEHGVSFDPGSMFRADGASSPIAFRICHSATAAPHYDEALGRLARAFRVFTATAA